MENTPSGFSESAYYAFEKMKEGRQNYLGGRNGSSNDERTP